MKIFLFFLLLICLVTTAFSQQNHFIYVQADNKQPFYIKLDNKVYSSSASGYAIISKLQKGNYNFLVGFPKNEYPVQNIMIKVEDDAGYLLKNFGDKGWGFFNIQTLAVLMGGENAKPVEPSEAVTKQPAHSENVVVATPAAQPNHNDKILPEPESGKQVNVKETLIVPANSISVLSIKNTNDGQTILYQDHTGNFFDTISVFIQAPVTQITSIPGKRPPAEKLKDKQFLDIDLPNPNSIDSAGKNLTTENIQSLPAVQPVNIISPVKPLMINSDCKAIATEDDFYKIRKKMASENSEEAMIAAAKKMFRQKCYSTEQVKNLGLLFLNDSGKYNFFDVAYPYISDTRNFPALQSQLSDPYYLTRFKAMIRN